MVFLKHEKTSVPCEKETWNGQLAYCYRVILNMSAILKTFLKIQSV